MTIIDLTHTLNNKTTVYPGTGEKSPYFEQTASIELDGYTNWTLTTGLHIGTHIDSPAHMLKGGNTLDMATMTQLCCKAYAIDARNRSSIGAELIEPVQCQPGSALLVCTGYDSYYGKTEYFTHHPVLTKKAAEIIIEKKFGLVGLDTPSPDRFPFTIHKLLFSHNILIIENLTQVEKILGASTIMLYALPLKCKTDGAPARVIAMI